MGLDMYVWKIKKCSEEEAKSLEGKLMDREMKDKFTIFMYSSEEALGLIKPIMPWLRKVNQIVISE